MGVHFITLTQNSTASPSLSDQTGTKIKKKKKHQKEEVKLPLFSDDMILYIENRKDSTKELLDPKNEVSKVAD